MTLYTESSDGLVTLAAASIVTGWSEPVPGREFHPLKSSAFHGALFRQLSRSSSGDRIGTFRPCSMSLLVGDTNDCKFLRCTHHDAGAAGHTKSSDG